MCMVYTTEYAMLNIEANRMVRIWGGGERAVSSSQLDMGLESTLSSPVGLGL